MDSKLLGSNRFQNPKRKQQNSTYQLEDKLKRKANDTERKQYQPNDREQKKNDQRKRPAQNKK